MGSNVRLKLTCPNCQSSVTGEFFWNYHSILLEPHNIFKSISEKTKKAAKEGTFVSCRYYEDTITGEEF